MTTSSFGVARSAPPPPPLPVQHSAPPPPIYQQQQQQQGPPSPYSTMSTPVPPGGAPPIGDGHAAGGPAPQVPASLPTAPPIPAAPPLTNTASDNPDTRYLIDRLKQQTTGPGTSNAAIQQAGQAIGQFAEGGRNQLRNSLASRGMLGTSGAEDALGGEITNRATQQFGQAASNIALGRQNQIDQTLLGAQGIFAEPGRQQLGQQQLGLSQYQAQNQAQQGAAGLQLQQQALQNQAQQQAYQAQLQQQQLALAQFNAMQNSYSNLYA